MLQIITGNGLRVFLLVDVAMHLTKVCTISRSLFLQFVVTHPSMR